MFSASREEETRFSLITYFVKVKTNLRQGEAVQLKIDLVM